MLTLKVKTIVTKQKGIDSLKHFLHPAVVAFISSPIVVFKKDTNYLSIDKKKIITTLSY